MEEGGAKRIVVIVALVAVAAVGVFWYWQRAKQRALGGGNVYVKKQTSDQSAASSAPPAPGVSTQTAPPPAMENPGTNAAQPATKPSAGVEKTVHAAQSTPAEPPNTAAPPITQPMTQPRGALEVPGSDTIPRNPTNGLIFAGTGKYQLYRQGDITWRLDTDNGRACIIFATDIQWSRNRVYDSGCGAS